MQFHFVRVLHGQQYPKAEITGKGYNSKRRKKEVWEQAHRLSRGASGRGGCRCGYSTGGASKRFPWRRLREGEVTGKGNGRGPRGEDTWRGEALTKALPVPAHGSAAGLPCSSTCSCDTSATCALAPAAEENDSGWRAAVSDHHCSSAQMSHADTLHAAIQKSISRLVKSGTSLTYFYQTGEASNSAISETAKTIRKRVCCCADQPRQIQPWGKMNRM